MSAEAERAETPPRGGWTRGLILVALLLVALGVRLGHARKGLPYLHHSGEPHTSKVALEMMKSGELNPGRFRYGSFNIYLALGTDAVHYLWLTRSPDVYTGELLRVEDIETTGPDNWRWQVSHPSFYLWNRGAIAALATLTVLLTFLLGRRFGPPVGLVAAALLAANSQHVLYGAVVSADVPVAFWILLCVALSAAYVHSGRSATLALAFASAGIAFGTKYNAVSVLSVPLLALALTRARHAVRPHWLWWTGLPIAGLAFLVVTPFALFDLPLFLNDVGREIFHYQSEGHGPRSVEGGLPHMARTVRDFAEVLGWPVLLLSLFGIVLHLRSRLALVVFVFPALYFLMQTRMVTALHHNFICIYPFLALGFGLAVRSIAQLCAERWRRGGLAVSAAAAAFLLALLGLRVVEARAIATTPETRTAAVQELARLAGERGWRRIGIDDQLRLHPLDLQRLDGLELRVEALPDLRRAGGQLDAILCAGSFEYPVEVDPDGRFGRRQREWNASVPAGEPVVRVPGSVCPIGVQAIDPEVLVFEAPFRGEVPPAAPPRRGGDAGGAQR